MNIKNKTNNKAVIYCRVSTKEQAEEGNSLTTQERNCREYATKHEYEIPMAFIEQGESAKTADRTELQKLLRYCSDKKNQISAVIIYKIDRLSRNTDDYSQLRLLLKRYNVEIKSTSEFFENTPAGRFMENIIANVAQFDNDVRTERSVGGMKGAVREGRYVWMAPVGYKNQKTDGKATIAPDDHAQLVRLAFQMMTERSYTVDRIRKSLSDMGLSTRSNKPLSRSQFYKMLKNELYTGWICKFGEKHKGTFESIIPEALFNRVKQIMRNKKTRGIYRKEHPDFPLRRFVSHPHKYKLTGAWSKGRNKCYPYYRFIGTSLQWRKHELENLFTEFMNKFEFDYTLLDLLKNKVRDGFSQTSNEKARNVESLISNKLQLKEKQTILLEKNINGIISDVLLKEQLALLDEEIWNIDSVLLKQEENKVDFKKIFEFISEYLIHPSQTWKDMPFHIKLKLQWFQFPDGVILENNEFRTTKVSSLFKLKQLFLPDMSFNVPHPRLNYEHADSANFSALQYEDSVVLAEARQQLKELEAIINTPPPEEEEYLWAA